MGDRAFKFNFDKPVVLMGLAIFALGLLIRLVGVTWGLPSETHHHSYHPDEEMVVGFSSVINPPVQFTPARPVSNFYSYGTLYLSLMSMATDVVNGYGGGPHAKDGSDAWQAVGHYILAGRVLNCIFGALIGWVIVAMLWRRVGPWGAAAGGIAACLAPGMIVHSRFATVDVLATLFATLSLYWMAKVADKSALGKDATKALVYAGIFAGLSAGTKYTAILLVFAIAASWWVADRRSLGGRAKDLLFAVAAAAVVFVVATPGSLLDFDHFIGDFKYEVTHTSTGHGLVFAHTASGFLYHLSNLATTMSITVVALGTIGLAWAMYRRHPWMLGVVVFGLLYFVLIGRAEVKFLRYVFPLVPVVSLGFGWLFSRIHAMEDRRWLLVNVIGIAGLMGMDTQGAFSAIKYTAWMNGPDPREVVGRELLTTPGSVGIVQDAWYYTPDLYPEAGASRAVPFTQRLQWQGQAGVPIFQVHQVDKNIDHGVDWDPRLLTDLKPDRVVFSSFEYDDLERMYQVAPDDPEFKPLVDRYVLFLKTLNQDYTLSKEIGADGPRIHDLMYIRPTLWVWNRKTTSPMPSNSSSTTSAPSGAPAPTP